MDWWPPLVGVVVGCILTYFFTRLGASRERKSRERDQLRSAVRNMLAEVEYNRVLTREPFRGRLVPFVTDMWDAHKGNALGLPDNLQDALRRTYSEIQMANALCQLDLSLPGANHYNEDYKEQRDKIAEEAERARELLLDWLGQHDVEVPH